MNRCHSLENCHTQPAYANNPENVDETFEAYMERRKAQFEALIWQIRSGENPDFLFLQTEFDCETA